MEIEDKGHILQCSADSARAQWKLSLQSLNRWMKDQGTMLEIRITIMTNLEQWATDNTTSSNSKEKFTTEQSQIGWDRMLDG